MNRLFERETMANPQSKPGIFGSRESASVSQQEAHASQGAAAARLQVRADDLLPKTFYGRSPASLGDSVRASQGRLPKLDFPMLSGEDPQLCKFRCENYFDMYAVESSM
jgi:hypothetical protein